MLKKIVLALMPLTLVASVSNADDDLNLDASTIRDAEVEIVTDDLDIDVDQLTADAGEDSEENAIEACFRRFGYHYRGWRCGYRSWGCYNTCYRFCRPLYSYRTISYCRPIYRCVTPIYHYYWGCH